MKSSAAILPSPKLDIDAALAYVAELAREGTVELLLETKP